MANSSNLILVEQIEPRILLIRGHRVLLDSDLAELYGVETKRLNEQVRRNLDRFPDDFMFQLTKPEQEETLATVARLGRLRHSKSPPYAFTEHGAIMAASVLSSPRAVEASIFVVRAFVKLRQLLSTHKELALKVSQLERKLGDHDESIQAIVAAIKQLMQPPPAPPKRKIGFQP